MSPRHRAELFFQMARLLGSGLPFSRCLEVLQRQRGSPSTQRWLRRWDAELRRGLPLGEALKACPESTPLESQVIAAAERAGVLPEAFTRLAEYFQTIHLGRKKALSALAYPLLVLHLGVASGELPRWFTEGFSIGSVGRLLLSLGALWLLLGAVGVAFSFIVRIADTSPPWDGMLQRLPFWGAARRHWALSRWAFAAESGFRSGISVYEVLTLAGAASASARLVAASHRAAQAIAKGETLGDSLERAGDFPETFVDFVRTGEHSGSLTEELARLAGIENQAAVAAADRTAVWLPKIGYLIVLSYLVRLILLTEMGRQNAIRALLNQL
ncbi:MAG: hypothetical protein RLZZ142_2531 [Verrucomicrobiota bacterium]